MTNELRFPKTALEDGLLTVQLAPGQEQDWPLVVRAADALAADAGAHTVRVLYAEGDLAKEYVRG